MLENREPFDEEHALLREGVRGFIKAEITPHFPAWEESGMVSRRFWQQAGAAGILCPQVPQAYGGPGGSFKHNAVVIEEFAYAGLAGPLSDLTVHSDVGAGYLLHLGNEAQKQKWLPRLASGETVCAVAMTEPGTGSDLQAVRTRATPVAGGYRISGSKTFVSNGQHCDLVIVVARTSEAPGAKGISLILVEADRAGFNRGRKLDKLGQWSADTSELFLEDIDVPHENLLGVEGGGFAALMQQLPQERLAIAITSIAAAQRAFDITCDYVRQRKAFGQTVLDFQSTRHRLADLKTDLAVGWAFVDQCLNRHASGQLDSKQASIAKLWCSEMQGRLVDQCLQLHGGYGFMREYEICRLYADARVQRIYGGTSEIMRELIGRGL
ncbi:MAG: acyl-CoA dehydrogenase family protein [Rudaea sp.]|uniref:acyl-CoA dehydrogenase family protein n=1 Tax=Rudaea sp. TaxID=2136325 RepID=UPI0039E40F83